VALIRKKTGNFLEDFRLGQLLRHKGGRTITEGIAAHFTDGSYTANPLHKNLRYARAYGFERLLAPPGLVMAVAFSQTVEDISENARANLEYIDMRFGAPVYIGDTIETETTILGVKGSSRNPDRGVAHVQSIARNERGEVVIAYQRKVQVFKLDENAKLDEGEIEPRPVDVEPVLPPYDPKAGYAELAHLTNDDTYFEDFTPGDTIEHSRGRVMTEEHIFLTGMLDNLSQVHCNQTMIDRDPARYLGGRLVVYGGIPFALTLGLSSPDISDNSLCDIVYPTGRHTAPIFAGDTVFASTEIRGKRDFPGREDLGILEVTLRGHKFERTGDEEKKIEIFYLEREIAVKRRAFYTKA
jgi:2-methylfumaryl-CoA hydratase